MLTAKATNILAALYPPAPGMAGVLARTSGDPLEMSDYVWLADTLGGRGPRAKRLAQCLAHTRHAVRPDFLAVLRALRTAFLRPTLADEVSSVEMVKEIEDVAKLIQRHCLIPDHMLVQRLCQGGLRDMRAMCESLLINYGHSLSDIEPCADFEVISTGEGVVSVAQRCKNCARSRIIDMAVGLSALLVWRHGPAVIEVLRAHDGEHTIYICDGIYGVANAPVEPRMRREIVRRLRSRGILTIALTPRPDVPRWLADTYGTVEPMLYLSNGGGA